MSLCLIAARVIIVTIPAAALLLTYVLYVGMSCVSLYTVRELRHPQTECEDISMTMQRALQQFSMPYRH